jgi:hypothetical protein
VQAPPGAAPGAASGVVNLNAEPFNPLLHGYQHTPQKQNTFDNPFA